MNLVEWTKHYVKFKDSMKKQIQEIKIEGSILHVQEKKGDKIYYTALEFKSLVDNLSKEKIFLVTTNTKENVLEVVKMWKELINYKQLTIIFANPKTNESWLLHPATHHLISEEDKIKEGLISLYDTITAY